MESISTPSGDHTRRLIEDSIASANLWRLPNDASAESRTHLIGAEPFALTSSHVDTLERLGKALLAFYSSVNDLYLRAGPAWVKDYLDIGKGEELIRHAAMKYQRRTIPGIIRPDILITNDGFSITELDSVPGGFGHLDCLSAAYADSGWPILGSARGIRDAFATMLRSAAAEVDDPVCAIVVSQESVDYLPEMLYIAAELRKVGLKAYTVRPNELVFTETGLFIEQDGEQTRVDVLYRFFELFDLMNIPKAELISYTARKKLVVVTPPYKHFFEEKMLLAMLRMEPLRDHWLASLGTGHYELLLKTFAPTYIMDNRPAPPHAEISGFRWRGKPIRDWREIKSATQKDRELVIKPSGFSPLAWGARGVKVGHDMPEQEWAEAVDGALDSFDKTPHVIQPFQDTALFRVNYFQGGSNEPQEMMARVRLCPYYFVSGESVTLGGVLATACPKNKKLIHGMVDSVMLPCQVA